MFDVTVYLLQFVLFPNFSISLSLLVVSHSATCCFVLFPLFLSVFSLPVLLSYPLSVDLLSVCERENETVIERERERQRERERERENENENENEIDWGRNGSEREWRPD